MIDITFHGATREVTGSCFLVQGGGMRILVECGLIQGTASHERHNRDPFPFSPRSIDAVVLTHAHLDHSGRLPLLVRQGYDGPIYTHRATVDLCRIMLADAAYLNEKEAESSNYRGRGSARPEVRPLYDRQDAHRTQRSFVPVEYAAPIRLGDEVHLTLRDAGHILGSSSAELLIGAPGKQRRVVFTGDLGHQGAPIVRDPEPVDEADLVVMESTYGDRLHRPWDDTWREMAEILANARAEQGNILVPAFTVGRTQELLYVLNRHFEEWGLAHWQVFLDSPMAISATEVYERHARAYDARAQEWQAHHRRPFQLPNLHYCRTSQESMQLNAIRQGAIIIAGSGMCAGGRIMHHLKFNVGRPGAHVMIVGFQAAGTIGRALVDGARSIRLFGEDVPVRAAIHTIGGLSAHADQEALMGWYRRIRGRPPVALVHGEPAAMNGLQARLEAELNAQVTQPAFGERIHVR